MSSRLRRMRAARARCAGMLGRRRRERDLADEIDSHLQLHIDDNVARGMTPADARREALVTFGAMEAVKEDYRDRAGVPFIGHVGQDLRYALRMIRRSPGFTAVAVVVLALGIGVNTTVFTAFDAVALRPLPVKDPDGLARIFHASPGDRHGSMAYPEYVYYRDRAVTLTDISMLAFGMALTSSDVPAAQARPVRSVAGALGFHLPQLLEGSARPMGCLFVSGNYFAMLGAQPHLGRLIAAGDDREGAAPVLVLSGNFWRDQFQSDPTIVGRTLTLDGVTFTVIGVTPLDYIATAQNVPDLWAPIAAQLRLGTTRAQLADPARAAGWVEGRLKPGRTLADAQAELNVLASRLRDADPRRSRDAGVTVESGRSYAPPLDAGTWALVIATLAAVALLLLIACTNVASLLLARAAVRRREIAVRLSLGAGRGRLIQQLLTESTILALLAGAAGLPLSWCMLHLVVIQVAATLPPYWGTIVLQITPDVRVFAYTVVVSLATGVAFGLVPALQASRLDLTGALKDDGGAANRRRGRARVLNALVLAQIAACLVLLIASALLLRSSQASLTADPGFDTHRIIQLQIVSDSARGSSTRRLIDVSHRIMDDVRGIPGVRAVALSSRTPLFEGQRTISVTAVGDSSTERTRDVHFHYVGFNYFDTLGIAIVRGRAFTPREAEERAPVALVSEAMARRCWPGQDPIGRRIGIRTSADRTWPLGDEAGPSRSREVIGVVRDVRSLDVRKLDDAYLYLPLATARQWAETMLIRTDLDPAALLPAVGAAVRRADASVPVIAGVLDTMIAFEPHFVVSRVGGALATIVALFGLVLACLGVYGMVGYSASQRTREIGIRMALGAQRVQVVDLIVRDGCRPVLGGVAAGLAIAALNARLMASQIYGLASFDALSFGGASLVLVAVAGLAIWIPARSATRVDPVVALRESL